jgi:hypothetical protein
MASKTHIHDAIFALNPSIVTIRGDIAYDKDENIVQYDLSAAQTKATELEAAEQSAEQASEQHRQSAISKLTAIGLTADEIAALGVK